MATRPALTQAVQLLGQTRPAVSERLASTLELLLAGNSRSTVPQEAWRYGMLNGNGCPVEFNFTSLGNDLRYTVELTEPNIPPNQRLIRAKKLLEQLAPQQLCNDEVARLMQMQAGDCLSWGGWLGVRHRVEGDRFKIYAEVPRARAAVIDDWARQTLGSRTAPANRFALPVAIGHELGSDREEIYYYINRSGLSYRFIQSLLQQLGLAEQEEALLDLIQGALGITEQRIIPSFPEANYGFSISLCAKGGPPVLSIFAYTSRFIGDDATVRRHVLSLARRHGWALSDYAALSAPLARNGRSDFHNVMAFIVAPNMPPQLHISMSPPEAA
ncbi:MAG: hypothetical protein AAF490_20880 [Chloroflexota bacterium]